MSAPSKTKHTPGPWWVSGNQIMAYEDTGLEAVQAEAYGKTIAQGQANARLIAAAPDLYDVCVEQYSH